MRPSKTSIKKALTECAFDPRKPGPMKIVADISNIDYYKIRAIEFINESRERNSLDCLSKAIGLLALAKVYENESTQA